MQTAMTLAAWAGIFASLLGLALTVYGVFFNGRATRRLVEGIREDVRAVHEETRAIHAEGERRHHELLTFLRDMDRRHTEILAEIGKRI